MENNVKTQRIKSVAIFAVTFIVAFVATKLIFSPSVDKQLSQTAEQINKTCPMQIDRFTRLDNTVALSGKTFQYNYTLTENTKAEVNIDTAKKYVFPTLLSSVKTSPQMEKLRENNVTFNYHYRDKKGVFVFTYTITPDMYK